MSIYESLFRIQQKLKAPKNLYNSFGKYSYRSLESILEAVKPLLAEEKCTLMFRDEIELIGDRYYLRTTAILRNTENEIITSEAIAREDAEKKGMDGAQITGAASSYARKYAANALFAIDDTQDSDSVDNGPAPSTQPKAVEQKIYKCVLCGKELRNPDGTPINETTARKVISVRGALICGDCSKQKRGEQNADE